VDKISIVAEVEKDIADREATEKDVPTKMRGRRIVVEVMQAV